MTGSPLQAWLGKYRHAWQTRDAEAAAALFSDDASYFETPFGAPARGRDGVRAYWSAATEHQRDVTFSSEIVMVSGDASVVRWQAEFTRVPSAVRVRLDGVFLLEFDPDGLCRTLREWWHRTEAPKQANRPPHPARVRGR